MHLRIYPLSYLSKNVYLCYTMITYRTYHLSAKYRGWQGIYLYEFRNDRCSRQIVATIYE